MKKIIVMALLAALVLTAVGCESKKKPQKEDAYTEWVEVLTSYERVIDRYLVIVQQMAADPTNASIMNEYTQLMAEIADFGEKTSHMDEDADTMTDEEYAELCAMLLRIEAKWMQTMYSIGS